MDLKNVPFRDSLDPGQSLGTEAVRLGQNMIPLRNQRPGIQQV